MTSKKKPVYRFAVYGTLRRKGCREHVLNNDNKDIKFLGTFGTEPIFTMYSCGSYPGLQKGGKTSIMMEVYETTDKDILDQLDEIEGVRHQLFHREKISTPYGDAWTYYKTKVSKDQEVIYSGDFIDFIKTYSVLKQV